MSIAGRSISRIDDRTGTHRYSRTYIYYIVLLLFLANVMNYGQRMLLSILAPDIKSDIGLSDTQLGLLLGGAFALFFAVAGVPLARVADRYVRRSFLSCAIAFWSAMTVMMGNAGGFLHLFLARMGLGVGQAVCIPSSHSLISDYVPHHRRASALAIHSTGGVVGLALSLLIGGYLVSAFGWRTTMFFVSVPGFVVATLIYFTMKEPPRGYADGQSGQVKHIPLRNVLAHLASSRTYLCVLAAVCLAMFVEYGLNQWLPSFYVRQFGIPIDEVGYYYGLAIAIGGTPGSVLGGFLADRLIRRDPRWMLWFPAAAYAIAIPIGLLMLTRDDSSTALILNGIYAFIVFANSGPLWVAVFVLVRPMMRATTSAITLLAAGIFGLALGPIFVGAISDGLAASLGQSSLRASLVAIECSAVFVILSLILAARYLPAELHRDPVGRQALRQA